MVSASSQKSVALYWAGTVWTTVRRTRQPAGSLCRQFAGSLRQAAGKSRADCPKKSLAGCRRFPPGACRSSSAGIGDPAATPLGGGKDLIATRLLKEGRAAEEEAHYKAYNLSNKQSGEWFKITEEEAIKVLDNLNEKEASPTNPIFKEFTGVGFKK